jgi:hypothetical protein
MILHWKYEFMRIKNLLTLISLSQLGACSVIPGQHMWHFATQPSVDMPVTENDAAILNKLDFEPITAQLIDYLEKDFNNVSLGSNTGYATTGSGSAVFAGGSNSTRSRSLYMVNGRMTMAEALSDAGGINQDFADAARIFIFRGGQGKSKIFYLDAKSPDAFLLADRFPLQPHDVIFIDRIEGIRWNQIIEQIQPTINFLNSVMLGILKLGLH